MKNTKLLNLLLIIVLLKGIVWSLLIPLWHFPDEQAHFGHIALNVENPNLINSGLGLDLNQEIATSEELLQTFRNIQGNNSFTYHPEFNLEYSNSQQGINEQQIKNLPLETRFNLVGKESAYYPETYYNLSGLVYKLLYQQNIFVRVFSIRIFWLFLSVIVTWSAYQLAFLIKPKNQLFALTIATLTAFHPKLTFVGSGVTSDNLFNALYSLLILICAQLILKFSLKKLFAVVILTAIGINTKPQFLTSLAISIPSIIISILTIKKKIKPKLFLLILFISVVIFYIFGGYKLITLFKKSWLQGMLIPYFSPQEKILLPDYTLFDHSKWTINHTFREVVPWYWGVFRWLSLTLPRWVNRVFNRLMIISAIGLIAYSFSFLKSKKHSQELKIFLFTIYTAIIYFLILLIWDWSFFRSHNFSFGIQGRYYFPTIISHMSLLTLGIYQLGKLFKKLQKPLLFLLSTLFIVINFIAFYHLISSYYDTSNLTAFINQASQYKPWFAKGYWLISALILNIGVSILYIYQLFIYVKNKK